MKTKPVNLEVERVNYWSGFKVWRIIDQSQTEHLNQHCTLGITVRFEGGEMEVRQRIRDTDAGYAEGKARVRLISQAPDLLHALEAILASFVHVDGDESGNKVRTEIFAKCENMRAAIKNAQLIACAPTMLVELEHIDHELRELSRKLKPENFFSEKGAVTFMQNEIDIIRGPIACLIELAKGEKAKLLAPDTLENAKKPIVHPT